MYPDDADRREFLKAALATGGMGTLSACVSVEGGTGEGPGERNPKDLPERQFAWNEYLPTGPHGNVKLPNHQLMLFLAYRGEGTPTVSERKRVEGVLRTLERAYQWGTGGDFTARTTRGLLFFVGYSPAYFDRFDDDLPDGAAPTRPEDVIDELGEDAEPDGADAVLVLSSDRVSVLLSTEQALRGRLGTLNDVPVEASLTDFFDVIERRTGFLGIGRPDRNLDVDVPEDSPTAMGYRSGFKDNQAPENRVAIDFGPFADGSLMQVSQLRLDLDSWYDFTEPERVRRMFSPGHTPDQVGEIGEHLGGRSRISRETVKRTVEDAKDHNLVGHTQKVATARDENFDPKLLRRSEGVSTDLGEPGMNFLSLQRFIGDFLEARKAMNCPAHTGDFGDRFGLSASDDESGPTSDCPAHAEVPEENNGIDGFLETISRGTYLVPPRSLRSLPDPQPEAR